MQACDQYGRILLVSGVISKKSPQHSASFVVRCRLGVARGRFWREAVVQQLLTPAAVVWKRAQVAGRGFSHLPTSAECVAQMIDDDQGAAHANQEK
jgi:hypothetical protein